jgi:LysR family transcriptional regulator AphB
MIDLNDMLIFSKVAEKQGISPAARALRMPKSKVSRRMVALEEELGVRLLERSTRAVHLTEVGQIYFRHCKRIVEEANSARESVHSMLDTPRGHLRISTSVTIGQFLLAPHMGQFMAKYPDVEIEVNLSNRRVDVIAEGFDLVVRVGDLQDSTLVSKRLGSDYLKFFASPNYLKECGIPGRLGELEKHRLLVMSDSAKPGEWSLVGPKKQQKTYSAKPYASANDLATIRQIALDGGGIALLPGFLSCAPEKSGELRRVLPAWRTPPFNYHALYPSRRGVTLKVRAWLDFFASKLNGAFAE